MEMACWDQWKRYQDKRSHYLKARGLCFGEQTEEPFVKKNVSKEVSILHHLAQVFSKAYVYPGEVLKDLSG